MGNLEQRLRQNLVERADNGSALLEIVLSDLSALRASVRKLKPNWRLPPIRFRGSPTARRQFCR
jgi:hypothetical protein